MIAREKHSSLMCIFVNYGRKKFYNIGPGEQEADRSGVSESSSAAKVAKPAKLFDLKNFSAVKPGKHLLRARGQTGVDPIKVLSPSPTGPSLLTMTRAYVEAPGLTRKF